MASYVPSTNEERLEMLNKTGFSEMESLFAHIPANLRLDGKLDIEEGMSEADAERKLSDLASKNTVFRHIFKGAGAYNHYIPAVVSSMVSRNEFVTAYTPYQAEISQGVLKSIFEYQSMICRLLDMDVANASVYDGGSAAGEAVLMCAERKKNTVLMSSCMNPQTKMVVRTYCRSYGFNLVETEEENGRTKIDKIGEDVFAVIFSQPNYYGCIENSEEIVDKAHNSGAKCIMSVYPVAMSMLKTPGEVGADVAVGDGQPFGMPMAFGGPYLGFMAATQAMMRKLPGRIVGKTEDHSGRDAYVLTLQAREQHIKRERASSSICSNQALCALTATVYMSAMGKAGLKEVAEGCYYNAHYLADMFRKKGIEVEYDNFFSEFVTCHKKSVRELSAKCMEAGFMPGHAIDGPDGKRILWCTTEMNYKEEMDKLAEIVGGAE